MQTPHAERPGTAQLGANLLRRAESPQLNRLMGRLQLLAADGRISIPLDDRENPDPAVLLVKNRELAENRRALWPLVESAEDFIPELTARIPELAEPITEAATVGVDWSKPRTRHGRFHYISLVPNKKTVIRLKREQKKIHREVADMVGLREDPDTFIWEPLDPRILVMTLDAAAGRSAGRSIHDYVRQNAKIEMTLRPLGEPREHLDT